MASTELGKEPNEEIPQQGQLGTFGGVFTPSILTILGIILFLRLGYVVGAGGLPKALVIIGMANMLSLLTSISLTATATNLRVKGGGNYYLISRTLGVGYGGSIGLVLFLAQAVSIAFYAIGFAESVASMLGRSEPMMVTAIAGGTMLLLSLFAWLGADWATRFQYVVMVVLLAALVSFFVGAGRAYDSEVMSRSVVGGSDVPFWTLFALFFPAVTGFTQGVNMSGDLKDPGRSIPRGTFAAVIISAVIYFLVAILLAASVPGDALVSDFRAMRIVSAVPWLTDAGVVAATLSSAMASYLGAPRILQAMAADRVFPLLHPFAKGHGPSNNPRRGVLLSGAIGFATLALGNLNAIAGVVSMFFLITYGLLNYATYFEARGNSPSFRPRFKWFDRRLSLVGMLGCFGAMIALDPKSAAIALALLFAIYQYLTRRASLNRWADSSRSSRFQRTRENLREMAATIEHTRDWRPVLVAITEDPQRRSRLMRFAQWVEGGTGFTTAVRILVGQGPQARLAREQAEAALRAEINRGSAGEFACVVVAPDRLAALRVLLQSHGLGPISANTVLLSWFDGVTEHADDHGEAAIEAFTESLWAARREGRHLLILEATDAEFLRVEETKGRKRRIDVVYTPDSTGRLMLMYAYLMTRTESWRKAPIRLIVCRDQEHEESAQVAEVQSMLEDVRISAQVILIDAFDERAIVKACADASIVFLPARLRGDALTLSFDGDPKHLLSVLPMTALTIAAQDFELDAEPEAGLAGALAEARDEAARREETARKHEQEAEAVAELVAAAEANLVEATTAEAEAPVIEELERTLDVVREEAQKTIRRAAKARAKADDAAGRARQLDPEAAEPEPAEDSPAEA